jgi:SAM-dependent methyltransferase
VSVPAGYYETRLAPNAARRRVWKHIAQYLQEAWPELRGRVVELGAGYCDFINQLQARERLATDIWRDLPHLCDPGVRSLVQGASDPLPGPFDAAFASNLLEHLTIEEGAVCLRRVFDSLVPGGIFLCLQPNFRLSYRRYFDDFTHRTIFTDVSLSDFGVSHGFELASVRPRFLPLTMKSKASRLSFLVPLYLRSPLKPLAGQMLIVFRRPAI